MKTLKGRLSLIYLSLVILIIIIGTTSVISFYRLSKGVNSLITDNYSSIIAANNMLEILQREDNAVLTYISTDRQKGIDSFNEDSSAFLKWYNTEHNHMTEQGEEEFVDKINSYYSSYLGLFSQMQILEANQSTPELISFYNENMLPVFEKIKMQLKGISSINEKSMFRNKTIATQNAQRSTYIILVLSLISVIGGFLLSIYFTGKFLEPVYSLTQSIKSIRAGNFNYKAKVISQDEIGILANEFNDMTNRLNQYEKGTMGQLITEKNKSLTIVKSISDPLIVLDKDFKFVLLNDACENLFNINEDDVLNKYILDEIKNQELFDFISFVYQNNNEYKQQIMHFKLGEEDYYFNIIVKLVRDEYGNVNSIMILCQDVTQFKQLEKSKADFISTISHEFKTPLTSIMLAIGLITNDGIGTLNKNQKELLATMKEDIDKLSELTNNLIEITKFEASKTGLNVKPCSIYNIINECIDYYKEQAINKGICLIFDSNKNLPMIMANYDEICWALKRLISESLKYTNAGDKISINIFSKMDKICLSIFDNGMQIPYEYQKKVFERFVQSEGYDLEIRGTGLGLAMVKEIIESHGGEIWCESKKNFGNVFTFTLPQSS